MLKKKKKHEALLKEMTVMNYICLIVSLMIKIAYVQHSIKETIC